MKKLKRKSNDDETDRLGFHKGEYVKFTNRYFANHGLKYVDLGDGIVVDKIIMNNAVPKVVVKFPFNREFYQNPALKVLLSNSEVNRYKIMTLLEIYPAYLEKA